MNTPTIEQVFAFKLRYNVKARTVIDGLKGVTLELAIVEMTNAFGPSHGLHWRLYSSCRESSSWQYSEWAAFCLKTPDECFREWVESNRERAGVRATRQARKWFELRLEALGFPLNKLEVAS